MADDPFAQYAVSKGADPFAEFAASAKKPEPPVRPVSAVDLLSRTDAGVTTEQAPEPGIVGRLVTMMQPMAHPRSLSDMGNLLLPSVGVEEAAQKLLPAIPGALRATARGAASVLEGAPAVRRSVPFAESVTGFLRTLGTPPMASGYERYLPNVSRAEATAAPTTSRVPYGAPVDAGPALSDAALVQQEVAAGRLHPSVADRITNADAFRAARDAKRPPVTIDRSSLPPEWRTEGSSALQPQIADTPPPTLGQPRVLTPKATPTSWTPEAARARIEMQDFSSGMEPGSAEAQSASALHKYDGEMRSRLSYLLSDPKAALAMGLSPALLRAAILQRLSGGTADKPAGQ